MSEEDEKPDLEVLTKSLLEAGEIERERAGPQGGAEGYAPARADVSD